MNNKLLKIQSQLKAPKNQMNAFGGYNYRSCEDIFEAVKPLLEKENLVLRLTDELVNIGERYYIKATAILTDGNETIENTAYAREEESKKGMDGSQITGASSSYARKYALNGLFLIDDVKDSDTTNIGVEITSIEDAKAYRLTWGKYAGKTLGEIDESYLQWLLENTKDETIKTACDFIINHITSEDVDLLAKFEELIATTGTDREKLYEHYGVTSNKELTKKQLIEANKIMQSKLDSDGWKYMQD